jgi:siroheme synthase
MFGCAEERAGADTAAIYRGAGEGPAIAAALIAAGKPPSTPVAIVENASLPNLSVAYGTLARLPRLGGGPVLILIGEVYREAAAADRAARNFRQASA